jgi:hypothetical protein
MKRLILSLLPCLLSAQALPEPARIQAFQTSAKVMRRGGSVTLHWSATGADHVRLEPLGLILPAKGELTHLVTGRIVYWLHVSNAAGGQSAPLVVELPPEETAPAVPAAPILAPPAMPPVMPLAMAADLPRLASLSPVQALSAPALPVALPAGPPRRLARRHAPRRAWIQFAALVSTKGAARLQRNLQRVASMDATLLLRNRHSGRPFQLIRSGPFPSVQAARLRLQELAPAMHALNIRPLIIVGPPQAVTLGTTYLADGRQPKS